MKVKQFKSFAITLMATIILVACGGGGASDATGGSSSSAASSTSSDSSSTSSSSSSSLAAGTVTTGRFLDSAIEGVEYESASYSGTTDANGEFQYVVGEEITFKLYGKTITTVTDPTAGVFTPADISSSDMGFNYSSGSQYGVWKVLNVLRLVQTLDTDSDPTNGITLPKFDYTDTTWECPDGYGLTKVVDNGVLVPSCVTLSIVDGSVVTTYVDPAGDDDGYKAWWWNHSFTYIKEPSYFDYTSGTDKFLAAVKPGYTVVSIDDAVAHFNDTIGTVSDENPVVLTLPGKTATIEVVRPWCLNTSSGSFINTNTFSYTFTDTGWTQSGRGMTSYEYYSGSFESIYSYSTKYKCYTGSIAGNVTYSGRSEYAYFPCTSGQCKYKDVNRMEIIKDTDGTNLYMLLTWYNANEKKYFHQKKYMKAVTMDSNLVIPDVNTTVSFN